LTVRDPHLPGPFVVTAVWEAENAVWVATSDEIPGLIVEAGHYDELLDLVTALAPELIRDNRVPTDGRPPEIRLVAERGAPIALNDG